MLEKLKNPKVILILILIMAIFLRTYRIWYPNAYVFDEVYHGFTAKEYLKGSLAAWEWWNTPPPGVAYEWTHPPLAKEMMAASMYIAHSTDAWAWRLPGALMNVLSVYLLYKIALALFKNQQIALVSAFVFSLDGLNFVQSRTGMNDSYLVAFILASLLFFIRKKLFLASLFFGLALASKWAAVYLLLLYVILILSDKNMTAREKIFLNLPMFVIIPVIVYLISYFPFFWLGHSANQFVQLQEQMWWYHTHLKASHDYSSPWWSWPLNLYPVWYYVQYFPNGNIANIFASGNSPVFLLGAAAMVMSIYNVVQNKSRSLAIVILGFLVFWLPWAASPRIMFLYHYSASVPFMSLALGYQMGKLDLRKTDAKVFYFLIGVMVLGFIFFYPFLTGLEMPKWLLKLFFFTNLTKNPFGRL